MAYIHVYNQGGQQLSEGDGSLPLQIGPLNASNNEGSAAVPITIKTDAGYVTYGNTVVSFEGETATKWSVCDTADGTFGPELTITEPVTETGTTIYVKTRATDDEAPSNDVSVDIKVAATISVI